MHDGPHSILPFTLESTGAWGSAGARWFKRRIEEGNNMLNAVERVGAPFSARQLADYWWQRVAVALQSHHASFLINAARVIWESNVVQAE